MSNVVDNRVVEMRFDNKQFESGVKTSMGTLQRLKDALNFNKSAQALDGLTNAFNRADFSGLSSALYSIQDRFSTFGIIGMTALKNLTNAAMNLGSTLINKILSPLSQVPALIKEGGKQRALNVQQAKFQMEGLGLDFKAFDKQINDAVSGTRFGYDEAAMAASQLAASGIKAGEGVGEMGHALLAISGVAAMTNSEYSDMSNIFTTVASNGRLMTENIRSFSARGLNVTAEMAKQWGKTEAEVQDMVSKGKVSFQMFSEAMYDAYAKAATKADETFTGVSANIRAAWKKIGQDFWTPIVENNSAYVKALGKFKDLVNKFIRPATKEAAEGGWTEFVNLLAEGLDKFLSYEPMLKGIDSTIRKITAAIGSLNINDKIRATYKSIGELVKRMERFKETFKTISSFLNGDISKDSAISSIFGKYADFAQFDSIFEKYANNVERIQNVIKGAQSAFHIFTSFLSAVGTGFSKLLGHIFPATDGFLSFGSTIAENVTQLDEWLTEHDIFNRAIEKLDQYVGPVLDFVVKKFNELTESFRKNGPQFSDFTTFISKIGQGIRNAFEIVGNVFAKVKDIFSNFIPYFKQALEWLKQGLSDIGKALGEFFNNMDFNEAIGAVTAGGGLGILISFISKIKTFFDGIEKIGQGGFNFWGMLQQLQTVLTGYQSSIDAAVLKEIAVSIGILVGSLFVLTLIDAEKLSTGVKALGAVMAEFALFLQAFSKINSGAQELAQTAGGGNFFTNLISNFVNNLSGSIASVGDAAKKIGQGASIIAIAGAIFILAGAVKKLGELDTEAALQGVIAMGVIFKELELFINNSLFTKLSADVGKGFLLTAASIVVLSKAVEMLGSMDIGALVQGGIAVGVLLTFMDVFLKYLTKDDKKFVSAGVGMIAFAAALILMSKAVQAFGTMDVEQMGQGLVGVAISLAAMVTALNLLDTKGIFRKVIGLAALAGVLLIVGDAVGKMGALPVESMGQGLAGLGAALVGLVLALNLINTKGLLSKAIAITSMAGALEKIAISIIKLSTLSLAQVGTALLALAGAFTILGIAGFLLEPVAPVLMALSKSMSLFGLSVALVGAGVLMLGIGLTSLGAGLVSVSAGLVALGGAFAAAGTEIVVGITAIISGIIMGIAASATALAEGFVTFLIAVGNGASRLIETVVQLGTAIIQGIIQLLPQIVDLILLIISEVLRVVVEAAPQIVLAAAQLMVAFIEGITQELPNIVEAAFNLIITFIDTMAVAIDTHGPELVTSFSNLIGSIIHFLAEAAFQFMWAAIEWIAQLVIGIVDGVDDVISGFSDLVQQAIDAVTNFWGDFVDAGKNLVQGLIDGIGQMAGDLWNAGTELASGLWDKFTGLFDINSPSRLMRWGGKMIVEGLVLGIADNAKRAVGSIADMGQSMADAFSGTADVLNDAINSEIDLSPTITPVIDLSGVTSSAGALNGLFGDQTMRASLITGAKIDNVNAVASINSKWNPTGDEDVVESINELHNDIADLNNRIQDMNDKDATYEFNLNTQLDGRNIARSTARYNRSELALLDRNANRKGGKVR